MACFVLLNSFFYLVHEKTNNNEKDKLVVFDVFLFRQLIIFPFLLLFISYSKQTKPNQKSLLQYLHLNILHSTITSHSKTAHTVILLYNLVIHSIVHGCILRDIVWIDRTIA